MQENNSAKYQGTYLAQLFNAFAIFPSSFDEFQDSRIGGARIADIPSQIKENQFETWKEILDMDFLITPFSDSIKVAEKLYLLRPHMYPRPEFLQEQTDIHHAFVRLMELWNTFEEVRDKLYA